MLQNKFNITLILVIAVISTVMLVGVRFGAVWAGGEGYVKHQQATYSDNVQTTYFKRGELISTMPDAKPLPGYDSVFMLRISFGDATIWLDESTEVKLINGIPGEETIQVLQGRVVVDGPLTIEVRELDLEINGTVSFVHYSWLDEIEIAVIQGEAMLTRPDQRETLTDTALKTTTLQPYIDEIIEFNPETSEAAAFYEIVLPR